MDGSDYQGLQVDKKISAVTKKLSKLNVNSMDYEIEDSCMEKIS